MFQAGARRFEDDTYHNDLNLHMASPSRFLIDTPDFPIMPSSPLIPKIVDYFSIFQEKFLHPSFEIRLYEFCDFT
jgi:hypothetical protein